MTPAQIRAAVRAGKTVHWKSELYVVGQWTADKFYIACDSSNSCWGLFKDDGTLANSNEADFYIA